MPFFPTYFLLMLSFIGVVALPKNIEDAGREEFLLHGFIIVASLLGSVWIIHIEVSWMI